MHPGIYIAAAVIGVCAAGAVVLYCLHRKSLNRQKPEEQFRKVWADALKEDARVFNGLFSGLQRIVDETAKKPERILREWCQRTHYKWADQPIDRLCQQHICPLIENPDRAGLAKWARLLLDAATDAGVTKETAQKLVLTDSNASHYVDWDGQDLYPDDAVEILAPAWYQNGALIEQGQCKKTEAD